MNKKTNIILAVIAIVVIGLTVYFYRPINDKAIDAVVPVVETFPDNVSDSSEDDECAVEAQSLKPLINVKSPDVLEVLEDGYSEKLKLYVQKVRLKDQQQIEYSEGGCVHFSFELIFSPYTPALMSSHQVTKDALNKLEQALFLSQDKIAIFKQALQKALVEPDQAIEDEMELKCGDATCSLGAFEEKLILSYDMSL